PTDASYPRPLNSYKRKRRTRELRRNSEFTKQASKPVADCTRLSCLAAVKESVGKCCVLVLMEEKVTVSIVDALGNKLRDQPPFRLPVDSGQLIATFKSKGDGVGDLLDAEGYEVPFGKAMQAGSYTYRVTEKITVSIVDAHDSKKNGQRHTFKPGPSTTWQAIVKELAKYGEGFLKDEEDNTVLLAGSEAKAGDYKYYVTAAAAQSQAASAGLVIPARLVEAVQDMAATLKASTAPTLKRPKLPSALSDISQTAWDYVQQDFELQMVGLQPNDLPDVKPAPDVPAYQWRDCREDDQKDAYMLYIRGIIPLDERTEWIQGDKHGMLLYANQVHKWPVGEAELYHLSGTTDAAAVLTAYISMGLPWEGIRLTIEVKKQIVNKLHFEVAAQLICANSTSSKFKPLAILTDLVDEWHLKYMSGHKLCAGRFPSRAAAVACIRDWLQKEKVIETAETDEPLQVAGASDPGVLSPILKRARYTYRLPVRGPGEGARLRDLADCLPKEEAYKVLCAAGIQDLMQHYPQSGV
ncbi:hypothetical protein QJQ45_021919, partial [Haematococcus lacustris]